MIRQILLGILVLTGLVTGGVEAQARHPKDRLPPLPPLVLVQISISRQTLDLSVNGWPSGDWQISSAGVGYHTPRGIFHVQRMAKVWFSKKYDNSPMPNSLFFDGGIAIHGTYHIKNLGRAVSHGCVRLLPQNAEKLFDLAKQYGPSRVQIVVSD